MSNFFTGMSSACMDPVNQKEKKTMPDNFYAAATVEKQQSVSYTHLTLPTIYSV